jgi:hypothetical protein
MKLCGLTGAGCTCDQGEWTNIQLKIGNVFKGCKWVKILEKNG